MNDAVKTAGGVLLRHWLLLLLGAPVVKAIIPQEIIDLVSKMTGSEVIAFLGVAGVMLWGLYVRLRGKTKEKLARKMPANTSEAELKRAVKKQSYSAIIKTEPATVH